MSVMSISTMIVCAVVGSFVCVRVYKWRRNRVLNAQQMLERQRKQEEQQRLEEKQRLEEEQKLDRYCELLRNFSTLSEHEQDAILHDSSVIPKSIRSLNGNRMACNAASQLILKGSLTAKELQLLHFLTYVTSSHNVQKNRYNYTDAVRMLYDINCELPVSSGKKMELASVLLDGVELATPEIELLFDFQRNYLIANGAKPIECQDRIATRPCYLKSKVELINLRQQQGRFFYDMDNAIQCELYVFKDAIEFIENSHWTIQQSSILKMEVDPSGNETNHHMMVIITCKNRGNINLWCPFSTASYLKALVAYMEYKDTSSQDSDKKEQPIIFPKSPNQPKPVQTSNFLCPWVGENYKEGIAGKKVMVLGESHYAQANEWNPDFTTHIIADCYLNPQDPHEGWRNTYTKFERALAGRVLSQEEKVLLWNSFIFYNFIQEPMPDPNNSKPSDAAVEIGQRAFLEVIEAYKPERIIVWGKRLYGYLPDSGKQGETVVMPTAWKDGKIYSEETWEYTLSNGHICRVMPLDEHPARGFAWDYYHILIEEFLK